MSVWSYQKWRERQSRHSTNKTYRSLRLAARWPASSLVMFIMIRLSVHASIRVQWPHAMGTGSTLSDIHDHKILRFPRAKSLLLNQQMIKRREESVNWNNKNREWPEIELSTQRKRGWPEVESNIELLLHYSSSTCEFCTHERSYPIVESSWTR